MEMKTYTIVANFNGYIGCDTTYVVEATDEDDALEQAREMALDDLSLEIESIDDEVEY